MRSITHTTPSSQEAGNLETLSSLVEDEQPIGVSCVLMGCATAIPEYCAVPWYLFSDFRLGNAAGRPHDPAAIPSDSRWQVISDHRALVRCLNARRRSRRF
jgi:hypothetical protein